MAYQRFAGIVDEDIDNSNTRGRMQDALDSAESEMDSYSNSHYYRSYGPDQHSTTVRPSYSSSSDDPEKDYLRDFADELGKEARAENLTLYQGDCWIILDNMYDWGYGYTLGSQTVDNGDNDVTIKVGRALDLKNSPSPEPNNDTIAIIKHNIGHCMELSGASGHSKGKYEYDSSGYVANVSPMARSYLYASEDSGNYLSDTCGGGSGGKPSDFDCGSQSNYIKYDYCGGCDSGCRHVNTYSDCAKSAIESNTPVL